MTPGVLSFGDIYISILEKQKPRHKDESLVDDNYGQIKIGIDALEDVPVHRRRFIPQRIRDIARQACDERYHYDLVPQKPLPTLKRVTTHVVRFQTGCAMAYCD